MPVDSVIRKRSNSICHFHCLAGNSSHFQLAKSQWRHWGKGADSPGWHYQGSDTRM